VHAKEFWFPECRNCECCKGFKHGCGCCVGGVDTCAKPDCVSAEHASQVASELAARGADADASGSGKAPALATPAASAAAPSTAASPRSPSVRAPLPASEEVCKFFLSGGCRFGDSCRNKHPGAPSAPSASSGPQICQFFLRGNCTYGDSCRNSHVRPPQPGP
jgi:hypothetical protein